MYVMMHGTANLSTHIETYPPTDFLQTRTVSVSAPVSGGINPRENGGIVGSPRPRF